MAEVLAEFHPGGPIEPDGRRVVDDAQSEYLIVDDTRQEVGVYTRCRPFAPWNQTCFAWSGWRPYVRA